MDAYEKEKQNEFIQKRKDESLKRVKEISKLREKLINSIDSLDENEKSRVVILLREEDEKIIEHHEGTLRLAIINYVSHYLENYYYDDVKHNRSTKTNV